MTASHPQAETPPKEVEISFWLWISTIVLGLIGSVPIFFQFDQFRAQAINQALADDPTLDRSTIESVTTGALVVGAVIGLLLVVAQVIFVFLMRGGRNWGAMGAGSLLQLLLLTGAIATMFLPAARRALPRYGDISASLGWP